MKVIHLMVTGEPGGIEMLTYTIARNSQNENIMWFLFRGGAVADQMKAAGIPVIISETPRYRWRKSMKNFIRYCRENQVDIVINHLDAPVACAHVLAVKRALPHIKIFGYLHNDVRRKTVGLKNKLGYLPFIKAMHRCCDKVFAISEFVKTAGMDAYGLPAEKIAVIYNGVDIQQFSGTGNRENRQRMELIFVGRLIKDKGVHLLLDALAQLPQEILCHASVVGFGSEYERLVQQAETLGLQERVDFLGKRMDVPELLQQADYFVHPAIWQEGFGITLVEAMASGKPCIAFRGGAIPELISHGTDGFLVEMASVPDLANTIRTAWQQYNTDAYRQMSDSARKKAQSFHIQDMVMRLESFY